MGQHWISLFAALWIIMYSFPTTVIASPCAKIHIQSAVVPVGSTVTASCNISEDCTLTKGQDFFVEWHRSGILISKKASQDQSAYEMIISNFTDRKAELECSICVNDNCNVVDELEVKASYPPPAPQNLTCQLNLTEPYTLLCKWDPGQKTSDIPTNYTLHTEISDSSEKFVYTPAHGQHVYRVPRAGFVLLGKVQVHVVAVNVLGRATSEFLVLDPIETVKLDAPEIRSFGTEKPGCLGHSWILSKTQKWITRILYIEMKLTPANKKSSDENKVIQRQARPRKHSTVEVCGLLHGMIYYSKMRVQFHSGPWSEWSQTTEATTPIKVPAGRLVTWLKLSGQMANTRYHTAHLYWKPSIQFRPNSMNVSYILSFMRTPNKRKDLCETDQQNCSFQIPVSVRKVYLTAMNKAGKSNQATEVTVYRRRELYQLPDLRIHPESEESLLAEWTKPESSEITGYVLEWKALQKAFHPISFEIMDKNQTSLVVSGLKPYQPYEFSIYPKYKDSIGQSYNIIAYTKEKAPSVSPKLKFGEITSSYVEVLWDEIPLEQRNGVITDYKVFYWDENNNTIVIEITGTKRHVILKGLHPFSVYDILLMASTNGGSVNGSIVTVKTTSIDAFEIVLIVIPACVGLMLLLLGVFTCLSNHNCLKKSMWPMIPDPANSSIKKWTMTDSLQDIPSLKEVKDPVLVYLSHFSLLSLSENDLWKADKNLKSGKWAYEGTNVDEDHTGSSHDSGICHSGQQSESVSYATVVFSSPYRSQPAAPPAYLRSESTQPLLAEEEPYSPGPYEEMSTQVKQGRLPKVAAFSTFQENIRSEKETGSLWENFPMLRSLEIENIHDQA